MDKWANSKLSNQFILSNQKYSNRYGQEMLEDPLVSGHLGKCLVELLSDGLELLLLAQKFILKPVHLQ